MPSQHAKLSPSSSGRWLTCPGSVRLAEKVPKIEQVESFYSREGTIAHELGELEASLALGNIDRREYAKRFRVWVKEAVSAGVTEEGIEAMKKHIAAYVALILERRALYPHSEVLLEQRVDTGVPQCWGTSDVVIVSPTHVEIIDLKYGQGIPVSAEKNTQLMLYGLGALDEFGDMLGETKIVRMTIFQPRLGSTSTYEMSAEDLRAWRDGTVIPRAEEALGDDAEFNPTESACRFCPAAGICRARMEKATEIDFGQDPDMITNEEIGELLHRIPEIKNWCNAVEHVALVKAYSENETIPGWKVVLSGGRRQVTDAAAAIQTLIDHGFPAEKVARFSLKGLGDLEKLVGKKELPDILGDLLVKTPGSPALVPESDRRPAVSPDSEAAKEFGRADDPT